MPRAARMKVEEMRAAAPMTSESSHEDEEPPPPPKKPSGKAAKGSKKPSGPEPGPAVEGATFRVGEWRWDVDANGHFVQDAPASNTKVITKRDAQMFVRAVKRYGLTSQISDIVADVGGAVLEAPTCAQLSLYHALMGGCKQAVELAAAASTAAAADSNQEEVSKKEVRLMQAPLALLTFLTILCYLVLLMQLVLLMAFGQHIVAATHNPTETQLTAPSESNMPCMPSISSLTANECCHLQRKYNPAYPTQTAQ